MIWWDNEETVSIHSDCEMKEPPKHERTVEASCVVQFGRKLYEGKIASVGKQCLENITADAVHS